jgi:hypothetical protein
MAVIGGISLDIAYAMGIMADGTRCFLVNDMFSVFTKTFIVQDAGSVVAFITQGIALRVFHSIIGGIIVSFENKLII